MDLFAVAFLVFLYGVLSIDNALALALIVKPGIAGAIVFRILAISAAAWLMHWE